MNLFGKPDIEKMAAENDYDGLYRCLDHHDVVIRLRAAYALAEMNDGAGWRILMEALRHDETPDEQITAAAMLGELGATGPGNARRAVSALGPALKDARGEVADAIREALETIGSPDAQDAIRAAGYGPVGPRVTGAAIIDFGLEYVRPALPNTEAVRFLTPEQHLNNAVELREAELAERGLVECSVALWLKPDWAYTWYLRGVLFEDLERPFEARLAYRRALDLDSSQADAREALKDLESENTFPPLETDLLLADLRGPGWQTRRDAAAGLGEITARHEAVSEQVRNDLAAALVGALQDEEREVRQAAIHALGLTAGRQSAAAQQAIQSLLELKETSWLLRFSILEALSRLGNAEAVASALRNEMDQIQERNPVFSRQRDPLLEVEYELLMEIGVLALERTGDLEGLLTLAEANAWEEVEIEENGHFAEEYEFIDEEAFLYDDEEELEDLEEEIDEADEELESYVDEVALMVAIALERLAMPRMSQLPAETLERLSAVPDLTLIDVTAEDESEAEPTVVYDLSALRNAARAALN